MIKVITYGTCDMLHYGHIRLLERARKLRIGVAGDAEQIEFMKYCTECGYYNKGILPAIYAQWRRRWKKH